MFELVREAARRHEAAEVLVHGSLTVTYAELELAARATAGELHRRQIARFAILDSRPAVVLPLLAGASLAGVEACVYPPTADAELVGDLTTRFEHDFVVTGLPDLPGPYTVQPPDALMIGRPAYDGDGLPQDRPHLILTTGTTGTPRAVRHDWKRLVSAGSNSSDSPGQRWLLAYGMNQFGGLQVLLHVLGASATLVATDVFAPRAGLLAMREHRVTHASATPTFWRFLLAELHADRGPAPVLEQVTFGGEAPTQDVLDGVAKAFPSARISQVYAASELGSVTSVRDGQRGLPASVLDGEGPVQLEIRDGELWARSTVGMRGYFGEADVDSGDWRPTGDLVEVVGDRLLFTGRSSDVINVGGVKVHPLPVEERIAKVDGVSVSRVFGRANALTGAVVAVEVVAAPGADPDLVDAGIREACLDLPPASRPRSIRFVDEIATLDHKIVRRVAPATGSAEGDTP